MTKTNYYEVLNLTEDATVNDIRLAYKTLAKVRHPDTGGSNVLFTQLNDAYEWLLKNQGKPRDKSKSRYKNGKEIPRTDQPIDLYWNLFEVYNGIYREFSAMFGKREIKITVSEPARCINHFSSPALVKTDVKDYIVRINHTIINTSNSSFRFERKGYDLILTVLVKTDQPIFSTPLKGIKIDNSIYDLVTFDNLGLYEHTEDGVKCGNLIIDNSINRREKVFNVDRPTRID